MLKEDNVLEKCSGISLYALTYARMVCILNLKRQALLWLTDESWVCKGKLCPSTYFDSSRTVSDTSVAYSLRDIPARRVRIASSQYGSLECLITCQSEQNICRLIQLTFAISSGENDTGRPSFHQPQYVGATRQMHTTSTSAAAKKYQKSV